MTAPQPGRPPGRAANAEPDPRDKPDPRPVPEADRIALAALACRDVAALHGGEHGEVATYLPGRRVLGVRVGPGRAEVHLVAAYGPNVAALADRVRGAVLAAVPACQAVDVVIGDVVIGDVVIGDLAGDALEQA
jgi:hypothetical protein